MKPPTHWSTQCPECGQRLALDIAIKELPLRRGDTAMQASVKVDTTKMREHMRDTHGLNPTRSRKAETSERA